MVNKLRQLQLIQLEILKDIADFCEQNNLTYYLVGGTLLGAIRHKGFIPWDDDVDIAMYRDDYNKFIEIFRREMSDKYFVQNGATDKMYSRYITKIRLNGTRQVERGLAEVNMHHGIYIDIFPLDHVCNNGGICLKIRGMILRLLGMLSSLRARKRDHASPIKDRLKRTLRIFALLIPGSLINTMYDYVCTLSNKKEGKYTTSFASGYGWKKQLVKNDVYVQGIKVGFEGVEFNIPADYEVLLRQLYGDFMKLPPVEKRVKHIITELELGPYASVIAQDQ